MTQIKEIKKKFEKKFVGIPSMYHTEDHQNIQGYYSEKMLNIKELWSFIESTISQTRQELIEEIKKSLPSHPNGMISRNEVKKILDRI